MSSSGINGAMSPMGNRDNLQMVPFFGRLPLNILLLLGGNKNGQDKDIKQAKKIFRKYVEKDVSS
jgi:hypothetical protein